MLKRLREEIYGGVPEEFVADGSPEQAACRLAHATRRRSLSSAVVGRVSVELVALRRHRAFFSNSFAPVFRGRFTAEPGHTVLRGQYQLHPFVQAFMTVWFCFVGFFCIVSLVLGPSIAAEEAAPWWQGFLARVLFTVAGFLFGFLGLGMVRFSKWLSRSDVSEIRRHISASLGKAAA